MSSLHHNPERRAWRGRSYKRGGERVADLRRHDTERDLRRRWEKIVQGPELGLDDGFDSRRSTTTGRAGATAIATAGSIPARSTAPRPDDHPDPGALICQHENRVHSLGGGMHVCFACWMQLLFGGRHG